MSISRDQVEKVSLLARLKLSDEELDTMTAQLSRIVEYVDQLAELDTDDVEPMAHALDVANVLAADRVEPSLDRRDALASCAHHDDQCYLVPAVLGE